MRKTYKNICRRCGKVTVREYETVYCSNDCLSQVKIQRYNNMTSEERAEYNKRFKKNGSNISKIKESEE